MTTDARTRYTKAAIKQSLMSLLREKNIEQITVTELCAAAEINRATFYRYYQNQYDLLSVIENEMLDDIKQTIDREPLEIDSLIQQMFELLYQNKDEWILLMGANADPRIVPKIYNFFYERFATRFSTESQKMRYRFMVFGFSGIFDYWIKNGMSESPDKMASYLISYRHSLLP